MTLRNLLFCFFMVMISVSCIREEAPNAEADILSCTVDGDILKAEPEIDNESVTLTVKSDADITNLAPVFTLTPGATITPARFYDAENLYGNFRGWSLDKDLYGALYRLRRKHGISFRAYNDGAEEWTLPDIL